ncbi:MAG: glycosyltransferase family protein [Desulfarculus sp.]|nr:glycosyltransferase family protein [Desulfarculus sp.]
MKVVAIVQARMGSTRLPGKVLADLAGAPVLARCLDRLARATRLDQIVVATTTLEPDQALADWCQARGQVCFRGHPEDLLDRYYQAAQACAAQVVVRCTSDCPLIDPQVVDDVVGQFLERLPEVDYASSRLPRYTYPRGLDTEVMTLEALSRAWAQDRDPAWREHVTPYIYFHPEQFRIHGAMCLDGDFSRYRLTVDTPEDLALMRLIFRQFGHDRFSWRQAVELLERNPEWAAINAGIEQKKLIAPDGSAV